MYLIAVFLFIVFVLSLTLQTLAIYLAGHTLKYRNLSWANLLLVAIVMTVGTSIVQIATYFLTSALIALLASNVTSALIFTYLFKKRYGGSVGRVTNTWLLQYIYFLSAICVIVVAVRGLFVQSFVMSGQSMSPAYSANDYLLIERISNQYKRGDVVVHRYPSDRSKVFSKRIVGMPNETVTMRGGVVSIASANSEEFELNEPYVAEGNRTDDNLTVSLGMDEYFVLGDNRLKSADSRVWGPIEESDIIGKVWLRVFEGSWYLIPQTTHE